MRLAALRAAPLLVLLGCAALQQDSAGVVRHDHYVTVKSIAPAIAGEEARLYVHEVAPARAPRGVVLFIQGVGTPGSIAFDFQYPDYSWMEYLAKAGYDAFSLDLTGYGHSTRPKAMDDPCNVAKAAQAQFVPTMIAADCKPSHPTPITTLESDWHDIDAVVDYLRAARKVDKVALVGWSQAAPRAAGYAARHPAKVSSLFMLAPVYQRDMPAEAPKGFPPGGGAMSVATAKGYHQLFESQAGCPQQYDADLLPALWKAVQESDPVGAKWSSGVYRAPVVLNWGFDRAAAGRLRVPFAMVTGQFDKIVAPERVRALYDDLGSANKVLVDLACSAHAALWEKNRVLLFRASLQWLEQGKVDGVANGVVRLGY